MGRNARGDDARPVEFLDESPASPTVPGPGTSGPGGSGHGVHGRTSRVGPGVAPGVLAALGTVGAVVSLFLPYGRVSFYPDVFYAVSPWGTLSRTARAHTYEPDDALHVVHVAMAGRELVVAIAVVGVALVLRHLRSPQLTRLRPLFLVVQAVGAGALVAFAACQAGVLQSLPSGGVASGWWLLLVSGIVLVAATIRSVLVEWSIGTAS